MMVATMMLEIAATEFVDAAATRFAYPQAGARDGNAPRRRVGRLSHRQLRKRELPSSLQSQEKSPKMVAVCMITVLQRAVSARDRAVCSEVRRRSNGGKRWK
jgi:hypothetical protein